jgi:hypothetical protein
VDESKPKLDKDPIVAQSEILKIEEEAGKPEPQPKLPPQDVNEVFISGLTKG